jgi:hypothetical protein
MEAMVLAIAMGHMKATAVMATEARPAVEQQAAFVAAYK